MGQAIADMPDPLEKASAAPAAATQSADDLLSQLAGNEIDRLLAESDGEPAPKPVPAAELPVETPPVETAPVKAAPTAAVDESVNLDAVLDTAVAERAALQSEPKTTVAVPEVIDNSPQIELGDSPHRVPLILRPLEWLSSPLDPWPDQLREILGKIGLMTLINALAVLAYVLLVRRHHH